jgi:hypothetical protein
MNREYGRLFAPPFKVLPPNMDALTPGHSRSTFTQLTSHNSQLRECYHRLAGYFAGEEPCSGDDPFIVMFGRRGYRGERS